MTLGFYAIIWKGALWFSLSFFSLLLCFREKEQERDQTILLISHSHQQSENLFSFSVILSGHKILKKKNLLKLSLQSSKIYLARDLPSPYHLWNYLSKIQISLCLFPAENHLKGPLSPNTEKDNNIYGLNFFPLKLKLLLPKPMHALYILPKVDYLLY